MGQSVCFFHDNVNQATGVEGIIQLDVHAPTAVIIDAAVIIFSRAVVLEDDGGVQVKAFTGSLIVNWHFLKSDGQQAVFRSASAILFSKSIPPFDTAAIPAIVTVSAVRGFPAGKPAAAVKAPAAVPA
jgi:hypothetical protein